MRVSCWPFFFFQRRDKTTAVSPVLQLGKMAFGGDAVPTLKKFLNSAWLPIRCRGTIRLAPSDHVLYWTEPAPFADPVIPIVATNALLAVRFVNAQMMRWNPDRYTSSTPLQFR